MTYLDKAALKVVGTRPIRPDGVDKVIGRAAFGADMTMPGMLWGKIKRSPHAHARIKSIDTSKAAALPGVKSIVTSADFPAIPEEALDLIQVEYEVLPFVIDVEDAMKDGAPVLHDDLYTQGVDPKPG